MLHVIHGQYLLTCCGVDEGLERDGTSMAQIPTYMTGVPDGTEKVSQHLQPPSCLPSPLLLTVSCPTCRVFTLLLTWGAQISASAR